ncbi:hypothetical protein [Mycolicibacterium thermoresistibile]|uniref:Bacteriophage membrane protein n=1 Tax=Mycolicibacterium thermoresistibile TaxID=1797 RepID=A0A100XH63_MYCTH|nr:hypothetical protein [Mycolicibacterium thermoresistibile]MCV7187051.1 hypothetical protein [Mycolicibacterium thermoresistibile]GAT16303.1 bacteriophage membrane protein [Mycolicibacterium thermoresistibile]SNW20327.1 bacteriophage membrane protein [Mycolicibacterium thermoresistibile]
MSDTRVGRTPRSDAEWARETERRLRALERARTARAGEYVLSSRDGRLVATKPGETPLEVGQVPAPVEIDLSARGSVVSDITAIATAVGYPEVDEEDPPSLDDVRQWVLQQLFGKIPPSRIPGLPWAHLFDGAEELLDDPSFDNPSTFANNPAITYDPDFGRLKPGSARIDADGTTKTAVSNLISVAAGEVMPMSVHVFYEGVTATGPDPIQMVVRGYHVEEDGTRTLVDTTVIDAVAAPSGESDDVPGADDGWLRLAGSYTVPEPTTSVDEIVMEISVTADLTAGTVWFDDGSVTKTRDGMPQSWILNLPTDLNSLWNGLSGMVDGLLIHLGIEPLGDLFDRIFDLGDALEWIQDRAETAWTDATTALSNVGQLMTNLLTDPAAVIGTIPQSIVSGLSDLATQTNQIIEILAGGIVTPVNSLVQAVKDWFNQWFGGGSNQAIPLSQKGAPNGVTPLGPNQKIPIEYFPDGFTPSEVTHPHFVLTLDDNVPVPNNTETVLSGWKVAGSVEPLWEDSTNTRWRFDGAGWWYVDTAVAWESNSNGSRQSSLTRHLVNSSLRLEQVDATPAMVGLWPLRTNTDGLLDVSTSGEFNYGDYFDVRVWQNSGGALDVLADETVVKALYVGERIPDSTFIPPVEYDNRGDGASNPSSTTLQWQHQASGTDRAVVAFVQWGRDILSNPPTVTYGGQPMDLVAWARHNSTASNEGAMAAYILLDPPTTTQTVTVTRQSGTLQQFRGNTVSYTGVGGYTGYTKTNNDGGMPITVPSAPGRRVANAIASTWTGGGTPGQGVIDGYQKAVRFSFSPGQRGGMYGGDAPGAATVEHRVTTTGGRWVSCTVDLHDTS